MTRDQAAAGGQESGDGWLTAFMVAGWLPLFLALAQVIRLQGAFHDPQRTLAFVPGWTVLSGRAAEDGFNWLLMLSLSGSAALLSWGLLLECAGGRWFEAWPRVRWRVLGGPAGAWGVLALWGLNLDDRHLHQDFWLVALFLHLPTVVVSYAILGSGLRAVRSLGLCAVLVVALWGVIVTTQLQFLRLGRNDVESCVETWLLLGGSLPLAVGVAMRLGIWGWAEAPRVQRRAS